MKTAKGLFISFFFIVWFTVSVVCMIGFSHSTESKWLVPVILGQFFVIFGIIGFFALLSSGSTGLWLDVSAIILGCMLVALPLLHHYGTRGTQLFISDHILTFVGFGIFVIGLCGLLEAFFGKIRSETKFTVSVEGQCVELKENTDSDGDTLYCPVYEIWFRGETLRISKSTFSNIKVPEVGEIRTLYIDENDLSSFAEPISDRAVRNILYLVFVPFIALGTILAALSLLLN